MALYSWCQFIIFKRCVIFCFVPIHVLSVASIPNRCIVALPAVHNCFETTVLRAAKNLPATINNGLAGKSHRKQMKNAVIFFTSPQFRERKNLLSLQTISFGILKKLYVLFANRVVYKIERTFEVMEFIENL